MAVNIAPFDLRGQYGRRVRSIGTYCSLGKRNIEVFLGSADDVYQFGPLGNHSQMAADIVVLDGQAA